MTDHIWRTHNSGNELLYIRLGFAHIHTSLLEERYDFVPS